MSTPVGLSLESTQGPQRVDATGRELLAQLRRQPNVQAELATRTSSVGERAGEVPVLGQIILTFLSAGAATALIGCLKAYIARDRFLKFRFKRADGAELELDGKHFDAEAIKESVNALTRFLDQAS